MRSIFWRGLVRVDKWGTVRWAEEEVSDFLFLAEIELAESEFDKPEGSLGVGSQRSGCAIWASRVS